MTPPSTTAITDEEREDTVTAKFFTYEETGSSSRSHAFEESAMHACRNARQAQRARTHARIARIPRFAMPIAAFVMAAAATLITAFSVGTSSAIALQVGGAMAAAYGVVSDVRTSITEDDPDWRTRHRVTAFFFRQHPLDRDGEERTERARDF
ncbi:hypothetical protein ACFZAD_03785 [Streptomyces iakyrus]|uniref:hypothetical protein n=1 Tax=Streptomyces iakyrus TaxID=68219 RepID=UPI0036E07325